MRWYDIVGIRMDELYYTILSEEYLLSYPFHEGLDVFEIALARKKYYIDTNCN